MINDNKITVLATEATDILVSENGNVIKTQKGGPALFITSVLNNERIPFSPLLISGLTVEILVTKDGEFGKVKETAKTRDISFDKIETPILLISTISSEVNIDDLSKYRGKIFLDIQGFVRDGTDFGKKINWIPSSNIFDAIYCLKGTEEELSYLPPKYIRKQKKKILLITKGKRGIETYIQGRIYFVKPEIEIQCEDTIGAGDTFFAYCVSNLIKTDDIYNSIKQAVKQTSKFLSSKNHHSLPL